MKKKIGINYFFETVLRAKPKNKRWSWGAIDHRSNRVFLRLWEDQLEESAAGKVVILWQSSQAT